MKIFWGLYLKKIITNKFGYRKIASFWGKYLKEGHREFGVSGYVFFYKKAL